MEECKRDFFYFNGNLFPCRDFLSCRSHPDTEIYEVLRVIHGIPLFLEEHYQRFVSSHQLKNIDVAVTYSVFKEIFTKLIRKNQNGEGNIKFVSGFEPQFSNVKYFMAWYTPHTYPHPDIYKQGVSTVLYPYERPQPNAKVWNHRLRENIAHELTMKNAYEALLLNESGFITEGSKSNFFAVRDTKLFTPGSGSVLPGITRQKIFEISNSLSMPVVEKRIHKDDLANFEAFFLTGTSPRVLPIAKIENQTFPPDHPLVKKLIDAYNQLIATYTAKKY